MKTELSRRRLVAAGAAGLSALGAALAARAQTGASALPADALPGAEAVAGVAYTDAERDLMLPGLVERLEAIRALRAIEKPNDLAPAQTFDPRLPGVEYPAQRDRVRLGRDAPGDLPADDFAIAFAPVWKQAHWLRTRAITARRLTDIYLARIARHAPALQCFVTVMADQARAQADAADVEIAARRYRGPLHGIPYGLKDLFDAEGAPTTWGAEFYIDRPPATRDSTVARRLKDAGAILLGKTTTGALAYGDIWFDGVTKNPWNTEEGSSGSSAGSASATAAGLIAFGIGTETLGSLVSPSQRCGTTALRPTFGRTSRVGAMALCWSLDKVGALCRSATDLALVTAVINGGEAADAASLTHGFDYDGRRDVEGMRVGYDPRWFENAEPHDRAALEAARAIGVTLVERRMPDIPAGVLVMGLLVEAAAAFEEMTLENTDDQLDWQEAGAWPNTFRAARFISAIDYVQIDRARRGVMRQMHDAFDGLDALIGPNFAGGMLVGTNFTGHPQLAFRSGFINAPARSIQNQPIEGSAVKRVPRVTSLWSPLFEERTIIRLAHAIESTLGVAEERPPDFSA